MTRLASLALGALIPAGILSAPSEAQTCTYFEHQEIHAPYYVNTEIGDLFGADLAVEGDVLIVGAQWHRLFDGKDTLNGPGAVFVFRRVYAGVPGDHSDDTWEFEQVLEPWDPLNHLGTIGRDVALSRNRVITGRSTDNLGVDDEVFNHWTETGSVYVYRYDGTQWVPDQKLIASDAGPHDPSEDGPEFGYDVSISGAWIAVGQIPTLSGNDHITGNAYLFRLDDKGTPDEEDDEWIEHVKIAPPPGSPDHARFGEAVAIRGDRLVVGAPSFLFSPAHHDDGTAYVYERDDAGTPDDLSDDQWILKGRLVPTDDEELINGRAFRAFAREGIDIDGPRLAVAAALDWPYGGAYVFRLDNEGAPESPKGHTWHEEVKLLHSDVLFPDSFGDSVALRDLQVAVGNAQGENVLGPGLFAGSAYRFGLVGGNWIEQQKLNSSDPNIIQFLGTGAVAIADGQIVVAAMRDTDNGPDSGSVYVFKIVDDCDRDCISDADEIAAGTSLDCDGNGIPDECEDCDGDGLANACDIAACPPGDLSCADCNNNELPDGCEVAGYFDGPAAYVGPGPSRRDCNDNGIPDDCDLANCPPGEAWCADCNGNRRPDVCDRDCNGDGVPDNCVSTCTDDCECWDGWECTRGRCVDGACAHEPALFGDVDDNGYVNVMDILCVLGGFAGSSACAFEEIDLVPCGGNGQITIFDLFAVLDVFKGVDPCCGG